MIRINTTNYSVTSSAFEILEWFSNALEETIEVNGIYS